MESCIFSLLGPHPRRSVFRTTRQPHFRWTASACCPIRGRRPISRSRGMWSKHSYSSAMRLCYFCVRICFLLSLWSANICIFWIWDLRVAEIRNCANVTPHCVSQTNLCLPCMCIIKTCSIVHIPGWAGGRGGGGWLWPEALWNIRILQLLTYQKGVFVYISFWLSNQILPAEFGYAAKQLWNMSNSVRSFQWNYQPPGWVDSATFYYLEEQQNTVQ